MTGTMQAVERRPEFTPPAEGGLARSFGMALLAHAVLALALSWGVKWKRDEPAIAVEAELWANAPQQAAPKPVEAPPAPPPVPAPPPAPPQPTQAERDAEIAVERERQQREAEEKARREEAERQRELAERRRQQQEEARKEQARKEQEEARREQARRAEEKRKEEQARLRKQQEEDKRLAELREQNLKRIQGLAGATGPREATGTAMRSSGPSASYAGRLAAHFQRHVVFPGGVDTIAGNPQAVVQVNVSPTGEILSARLSRSSGNPAWDEAAVRAIERSERIPPDVDGRYVTEFPVTMRPKS